MPAWRELKRFCNSDDWEFYKIIGHYFYLKILKYILRIIHNYAKKAMFGQTFSNKMTSVSAGVFRRSVGSACEITKLSGPESEIV